MGLTKDQILADLRALGVTEGMVLMAHSSLSALGRVDGGAEAVIEALAEAVGPTGTLCMPAMSGDQPFRVESSPSNVGKVTERFRSWPGVKRSIHPTHSVCCLGPKADEILAGHIDQPTALGPDCPWARIARMDDGYILLLGCDQDRCTLLHCAEEAVDAPYLSTISRDYVDESGEVQTKILHKFPGPHRDFIGLNPVLRRAGVLKTGKVGRALSTLMPAGKLLEVAIAALRDDPAAVLCDNPNCADCVRQRAAIKRHRLAQESFTLSALLDEITVNLDRLGEALQMLSAHGIGHIELGPATSGMLGSMAPEQIERVAGEIASQSVSVSMVSCSGPLALDENVRQAMVLAKALNCGYVKLPPLFADSHLVVDQLPALVFEAGENGINLVVENQLGGLCETKTGCEEFFAAHNGVLLAFNPAHFAHAGEHPFLNTFYKGHLKHAIRQLYVTDGCHPGGEQFTLPGYGNGEVKELISILRCRGFDGVLCLKMGDRTGREAFNAQVDAFWRLLENL
ncbi:MAG: AAC(3) family N-acetyltransferase [Armatimonadetes bacterium]|nr:AAC(3) family N-acetyltransferase [Armatimonadota bacterium]